MEGANMETGLSFENKGHVVWLYGMSGSGKTTVSRLVKERLLASGYASVILDGDELRAGINKDLGFTQEDRMENIRRVAEMARIIAQNNIVVICALISPMEDNRTLARGIVQGNFSTVFIDCPLEVCERRDVKGLYKLSRSKKLKNFTGVDSGFERGNADLVLNTAKSNPQSSAQELWDFIYPKLIISGNQYRAQTADETAV